MSSHITNKYIEQLKQGKVIMFSLEPEWKSVSYFWVTNETNYQFFFYEKETRLFVLDINQINWRLDSWRRAADKRDNEAKLISKDELTLILLEYGHTL